jgi:hypothetical protein
VNLEEQIQIFHPGCGGLFTGKLEPGARFLCSECGLKIPATVVFSFAQGTVEPEFLAALKRQMNADGSEAPW